MVTLVVVSFFLSLVSCQEPSRDRETTRRRFFDRLDHREILKARDIFRIIGGHFRNVSCRRPATALSTSSRSVHGVHAWRLEMEEAVAKPRTVSARAIARLRRNCQSISGAEKQLVAFPVTKFKYSTSSKSIYPYHTRPWTVLGS